MRTLGVRWRGALIGVLATSASVWLFGLPWLAAPPGWKRAPTITVIASATDPRLPAVREAVDFWNTTFAGLGTPFRLGTITRVDGELPAADLQALSSSSHLGWPSRERLRGAWLLEAPEPFARYPGDLLIVLSNASFISFSSRIGDRCVVAIKSEKLEPLVRPNVLRNVVAHELGHAVGLRHNADPTLLMCGRPASCRPDAFASDTPRFFPLSDAERDHLLQLYPASWSP